MNDQSNNGFTNYQQRDEVIHLIHDLTTGFTHSLQVNGVEGLKVGYNIIARNGMYAATTSYYDDVLPNIFMVISPFKANIKTFNNFPK